MAEARPTVEIVDVVRTRRLELLDYRDRVRMVLETGIGDEGSVEAGLSIRDRLGHERILVAQTTWGAVIDISHEGETIAQLQCVDDLPGADPGVGLEFCAAKGERALRWFVGLDGEVVEQVSAESGA